MSTEYTLYCRTCESDAGFDGAMGPRYVMAAIWADREAFAAAAPLEGKLCDPRTEDGLRLPRGFFAWCAAHKGHDVAIRDQYGRDDDTCVRFIRCPTCGAHACCALPREHEGNCVPRNDAKGQ